MSDAMPDDLDDEYEHVSDFDMSEPESDFENDYTIDTPLTAPQSPRTPHPSNLKTIPCPYDDCPKTFNRKARLTEHLRSHTNNRMFKCPHPPCTKDFLRDSHLNHHIKSAHSNVRDYVCSHDGCAKSFATGTRLRRHEATHVKHEKYRCRGYQGCSQTFRKHDTLKRHILSVHEQVRPFPCPESDFQTGQSCTKAFETAEKLRAHQRAKHDQTKFVCTECLNSPTDDIPEVVEPMENLEDADADYIKHVEVKPPKSAYFPTYADLRSHIASEHPPQCTDCLTTFKTTKELGRHLELIHHIFDSESAASATFACSHPGCARSFNKKGNLIVHIKTVHEKRRDFICGQTEISLTEITSEMELIGCGRDFTSKSSLEEHVRTAHLGMGSKRFERNKKRKADKQEADGKSDGSSKKRKPRRDKGVKKNSALQSLIGNPILLSRETNNYIDSDDEDSEEEEIDDYEDDDPGDNHTLLSGSTTMFGGQLYHRDTGHNFDQSVDLTSLSFGFDQPQNQVSLYDEDDTMFQGFDYGNMGLQHLPGHTASLAPPPSQTQAASRESRNTESWSVATSPSNHFPLDPLLLL